MPLRVVLVRPRTGENVGFAVRLCANFGCAPPWLVAPAPGWQMGAARTAAMCPDLLAATRVVADLPAAIGDCSHVIGMTARTGRDRWVRPGTNLVADLGALPPTEDVALLFGNEESGLATGEIACCTALYRIHTVGLASLNLSHAVGVVLWEATAHSGKPAEHHAPKRFTTTAERERLRREVTELLHDLGFPTADPHYAGAMQRLLQSQAIEGRDLRMLHRIARHLKHVMGKAAGTGDVNGDH